MSAYASTVNSSSLDPFPITPSDSTVITVRALLVAVGGDLVVVTAAGNTVTLTVPAGLVPIVVTKVKAATTATGITGLP